MLSFGPFAGRSFDVRKSFVRSSCNVRGDFSAKFGPSLARAIRAELPKKVCIEELFCKI